MQEEQKLKESKVKKKVNTLAKYMNNVLEFNRRVYPQ